MPYFRKLVVSSVLLIAFAGTAQLLNKPTTKKSPQKEAKTTNGDGLQLNNGKKWPTDKVVRKNMSKINFEIVRSMKGIKMDMLPKSVYIAIGKSIEKSVDDIKQNYTIPDNAKKQLNIILSDIKAGADMFKNGKNKMDHMRAFALITRSQSKYTQYFNTKR